MRSFFALPTAGLLFFVSSLILMLFERAVAATFGVKQIDYVTAMVVTIGLWLVVAPAAGAVAQAVREKK